jgi:hypothetical protein
MWVFLAGVAGIIVGSVLWLAVERLAKRIFLSGRKTMGRLIASARIPLVVTSVSFPQGMGAHLAARTLAFETFASFAAALVGFYLYLVGKATRRTYRILRDRRANAAL